MKTKTIFKKSAILVTVLVLAVVMSLATVVAMAAETNGETFEGVSVSTSGNVILKFYYSNLGNADSVVYTVEGEDPVTVAKDAITNVDGMYIVEVPLAAAEMTKDVTVYTMTGEVQGTPHTWSVKKYADILLGSKDYASYHKDLRALLLYGAEAQKVFEVKMDELASDGVFYNNTTPIANVTSLAGIKEGSASSTGTNLEYKSVDASAASYTWLKFYFTYEGEGTLTATVEREGLKPQKVAVQKDSYGYYVLVNNISATRYNTPYTVKVTDGAETLTMTKSVGNYLVAALNKEDRADIAKAMYQYYLMTADVKLDTASCAHKNIHYISVGENEFTTVCSDCFAEYAQTMSKDVPFCAPHATGAVGNHNSEYIGVFTDTDGTVYSRTVGKGADARLRPEVAINIASSEIQYVVFKVRTNKTDATSFNFYFAYDKWHAANDTTDRDYVQLGATQLNASNGEWLYYVVDAASMTHHAEKTIFSMNWYVNGGANATSETYIDIGAVALCADKAQLIEFLGDDTVVYKSGSTTTTVNKSEFCPKSENHGLVDNGDGTHSAAACSTCGFAGSEKENHSYTNGKCVCGAAINAVYYAPYANAAAGNSSTKYDGVKNTADGEQYTRFYSNGNAPWIQPKISVGAPLGSGEYFVFKIRTNITDTSVFNVYLYYDNIDQNGTDNVNRDHATIGAAELNASNGEWLYYVVDAAVYENYYAARDTKTVYNVKWLVQRGSNCTADQYVDVGFFALCADKAQALALIEADSFAYKANGKVTTTVNKTAFCPETHSYTYTVKGHQIAACDTCGAKAGAVTAHTFDATGKCVCGYTASAVYVAPSSMVSSSADGTLTKNLVDADGTNYSRVTAKTGNNTISATAKLEATPGAANYIVFKARTNKMGGDTFNFYFHYTSAESGTVGVARDYAQVGVNVSKSGEWVTYVIDISFMKAYAADPTKSIYSVKWLVGNLQNAADEYLDVSYFALCSSKEQVASLVDSDEIAYKATGLPTATTDFATWLAQ
jgi:hypothetical protein